MKRTGIILIWVLALLGGLLSGCGETPAPRRETGAVLPTLVTGEAESWDPEQAQNFPEGPGYTLPDANVDPGADFGEAPTAAAEEPTPPSGPVSTDPPQIDSPEDLPVPRESDLQPFLPGIPEQPGTSEPDPRTSEPEDPDQREEPDPSVLQGLLEASLAEQAGTWSVYVKNLDTGLTVCIHDEPMTAASLIKLFVAGAYYTTDPMAKNRSRCEKTDTMISTSSNDACNSLIDYLGKDTVNAFIRLSGYRDTVLNRKMLEKSDRENYSSARECGLVLESILSGEYVSAEASARLLRNLKEQQRTGKIPAGVPKGVETANKTGELSTVENDACIVWSEGGTYVLCIMSEELTDVTAARKEIVKLSELVYNYFIAESESKEPAPKTGR